MTSKQTIAKGICWAGFVLLAIVFSAIVSDACARVFAPRVYVFISASIWANLLFAAMCFYIVPKREPEPRVVWLVDYSILFLFVISAVFGARVSPADLSLYGSLVGAAFAIAFLAQFIHTCRRSRHNE